MTTLLFTNINHYLTTHGAFSLDNILKWAESFDAHVFVRRLDNVNIIENERLFYSSILPNHNDLKTEIDSVIAVVNPTKVVNLLEKFFPWNLVETTAEKIYFVRSCAAKLYQVLKDHNADALTLELYKKLAERESAFLNISDRVITDSPNSQLVIDKIYQLKSELCLEYIDPTKYQTMQSPTDRNLVYNIGRRDFQKGLQFVKTPISCRFFSIGQYEVGHKDFITANLISINGQVFEDYKSIISHCYFGIFPSIWESNGYAVQECLAMGKIPVVQLHSGGNERLVNSNNSLVIDFQKGNFDWEKELYKLTNLQSMSENARTTITVEMYTTSLQRFGELIC